MTTIRSNNAAGITLKGSSSTYNFTLSWETVDRVIEAATNTDVQVQDRIINRQTGGLVMHDQRPIITPPESDPFMSFTLSSSNESVTIPENGVFTHVTDGDADLKVAGPFGAKGKKNRFTTTEQTTAHETHKEFVATSLGRHITDIFDTRIQGKTASNTTKRIYSTQDHVNKIYVRNTSCWAYGLDITCTSPWNSYQGVYRSGTLVSPRDYVLACHYKVAVGSTMRFVTNDNQVVDRTVVATRDIQGDLAHGLLNEDVPSSIKFAKILPPNAVSSLKISKMGSYGWWGSVPILILDAEEKALIGETSAGYDTVWLHKGGNEIARYVQWFETLIVGDSGNPAFIFVNGDPVVLKTHQTPTSGTAVGIDYEGNSLAASMEEIGSPYQPTVVDLSGFPDVSAL